MNVTASYGSIQRIIFMIAVLVACSRADAQTPATWVIPAKYKTMKNPTTSSPDNLSTGKELYSKHCKSCHGTRGLGDGPKAATLDVGCGDFSTAAFQAQADGELFYKVSEGMEKMPSFKKMIPSENDRWSLVDYMRTFKAK
jgi:cytochrome c5